MTQTNTTENQQHIAAIVLVKAIPFYGYHTDYATYLKIYLIDPAEKQVMVNLLQSQALGVHYQPYEAHLPFVLQFLIDHNLYCMDQIHLDSAQYRPQNERESYCELELDATSMSIKNRWHLKEREIKEEPKTYLQSLESIWDKSLSEQQQSRVKPKRKRSPGQIMTAFEAIEALYPNEYYEQQLSFASENYEAWKVEESKVDLDLMDSYLEEMSAIESQLQEDMERQNEPELQDELEFQKELELQGELGLEDELDLQNELELQDDFGSGDLALWMKEAEKHEKSKHPVVTIEYEESDYEPLATQIQKNDAIFHNEKRVKDDEPFHISEIPPDILSRPTRFLKKFRLNQLDGASGYVKKKSQPSAKAQWDKEMRLLRQMRRKRKSPDKVDDGEMDVWVDIKKSPIFGRKKQKTLNKLKAQRREESAKIELSKLKARKQESRKIELDKGQQKTREEPKNDVAKSKMPKSEVPKIVETKTVEPESRDEVLQKTNEQDAQTQNNFGFLDTLDDFWSSPDTDPVPQLPTEASCSWKTYDQKSKDVMSSSYKPTIPNENTAQKEYVYRKAPPVLKETDPILMRRSHVTYKEPFYSKPSDVPRYPTVYNGKEFKLKCNTINSLKEFNTIYSENMEKDDEAREKVSIRHWMPAVPPPSFQQVKSWLEERKVKPKKNSAAGTQLDGPSIDGTFDFKYMASRPVAKTKHANDHVSFFSLEIHVHTRDDLLPDPEQDPVEIIFYCLQTDDPKISINGYQQDYHVGIIALTDLDITKMGISTSRADINYGETEKELILILIEKIRLYNPDMLVGYEVQNASWGYLIERSALLGIHLVDALSRINTPPSDMIRRDKWGYKKASTYKICGRHMLNVWRLMRHELTLMSYTFENVVYHLLHHRVPHFSHSTLTSWYNKGPVVLKHRLLKYYMKRVQMNLDILDASQVINRTCESARIFGMDFYSVLTRGSQFKVESLMFRIAKPENLLMVSPSRKQVAEQRSLECLPLVMEPVSKFYSSPMAVLDFQSLYPSIMIAHNYW
ncbi:hypothetical protein G6F56_000124 [Rhizopus delemar]|nr:hypothetical protein G6F56_000124 [Rhizopus delemar]